MLLLIIVCSFALSATSDEPRIRIHATKRGLDRISQQFWTIFCSMANAGHAYIADVKGENVEISDIRLSDMGAQVSALLLPPSTLGLRLENGKVHATADVMVCKKIIVMFCIPLLVTATASHVTVELSVSVGFDGELLNIDALDCHVNIGQLDLEIAGGVVGYLVNQFSSYIAGVHKPTVELSACEGVKGIIRENVEPLLVMAPVAMIGQGIGFDYGLIAAPVITEDAIELSLKGRFFLTDYPTSRSPYTPTALPSQVRDDHPIQIWVSETLFNDFLYFAHVLNRSRYFITQEIPAFFCKSSPICRRTSKFGDVGLVLSTASPPVLSLHGNGSCAVTVNGTIGVYAKLPWTSDLPIFQVNGTSHADILSLGIRDNRLTGHLRMKNQKVQIRLPIQSKVKDFVEALIPVVTQPISEHAINDLLSKGFEIPPIGGIQVTHAEITFLKRAMQLTVNPETEIIHLSYSEGKY